MKYAGSILIGLLTGAAAVPAAAAAGHYVISAQQVAAAISNMGVPTEPAQVVLLSNVAANTARPRLQVASIERWGANGVVARLQCESQEECLPFFVKLHLQERNQLPVGPSEPQTAATPAPAKPAARVAMRAGSPAILMLDGPHMQIRVSVVCLDAGEMGQTIHATDPDHRRVYAALVVGDGLLKGSL
jgi:hypothetical protein